MTIIYKYPLDFTGFLEGAERTKVPGALSGPVIHVGLDGQFRACLWIRGNADMPKIDREFVIVGTGWEHAEALSYVGTFLSGPFVWHVMEDFRKA